MAINDDSTISKETKEKVRQAIIEMGYHPNKAARSLVKGKTNNIAVVTPGFFSLYELHIIRGMEQMLLKTKFDILLFTGRYDFEETNNIMNKILYERNADAAIVIGVMLKEEIIEKYAKLKVPLILIDAKENKNASSINVDNYYAGKIAAEYFIRNNKKRPGIILGSTKYAFSQQKRLEGFKETLKESGIELELINESYDYLPEDLKRVGKSVAKDFLEKKVDAIFCANGDYAAYGVYKYLKGKNIRIPEEVSIVGCDNFDVAEILELTTIEQPLEQIGEFSIAVAEKMIKAKKINYIYKNFKPALIVRKT